jgi:hypothetical protein
MSRNELWRWSATRAEIDQRSREARRQLEHLERLLMLRVLPARPWLRRVLCWLGLRFFSGGGTQRRSTKAAPTGSRRSRAGEFPTEVGVAGSGLAVAVKAAMVGAVQRPSTA